MKIPLSISLPSQTVPMLCGDEDILVRAGGDYVMLCPPWQSQSQGSDGIFAAGQPWVLSSASVNFSASGVLPGQIARLTAPIAQYKTGDLYVVDGVAGNALTLRRAHQDLYTGNPPAPATGLTSVQFTVLTLNPQIEEASFDIKRRFGVDENVFARSSDWIYDLRDLRIATVLTVLLDRYTFEARTNQGDFTSKVIRIRQQLEDVLARVQVRWGNLGNAQPPSTLFSGKISR